MLARFRNWFINRYKSGQYPLFRKIARSLQRDEELPLFYLFRKAVIFIKSMLTGRFNLRRCDEVGKRPRTRRRPYIENMGKIFLGNDININSRNVQTDLVSGPHGEIRIGNDVSINFGVSIVANKRVQIGNRVRVGPYTMIYDSNQHVHGDRYKRAEGKPVVIEDDVWLASRILVLEGSRIGKGSLVASGSVVSGIIPPYVIVAGAPARIIRFLSPPENSGFMWERDTNDKPKLDETILVKVRKIASEVMSVELDSVDKNNSHYMFSKWDSFQHVKFIHALESEFNIEFDKKELTRIRGIGKACEIVQNYMSNDKRKRLA